MKLTIEKAKELCQKAAESMKDKINREFMLMHARHVAYIAKILAKGRFDEEMLEIAAWVHDIGKAVNEEGHENYSIAMLKDYEISAAMKDCILNHGSAKHPKTEEGKIIQAADKVSILNPEVVQLLVQYNDKQIKKEEAGFLRKMTESAVKLLEGLQL